MSTPTPSGAKPPEIQARIVNAIVAGSTAWSTPEDVVFAVGMDEDEVLDELASMDVDGLIEVWEQPEGLFITLSVLAAERFGYRLVETEAPIVPRWAALDEPDPPARKAMSVVHSDSMARFGFVVDPHPGPEIDAEQNEVAARYGAKGLFGTFRKGAGRGEPPRPTLLIGTNLNGWSGPNQEDSPRCPACQSKTLPAHAYCLCCDRWGLESPHRTASRPHRKARNPDEDWEASRALRLARTRPDQGRGKERQRAKEDLRIDRPRPGRLPHRNRGRNTNSA